jgi:predicted enzyme related to lactoylglutathione lyase
MQDLDFLSDFTEIDPRKLCQLEIHATRMDVSQKFYEAVFGWKTVPAELHNYLVLDVPPDCPFGISIVPSLGGRSSSGQIILYFEVQDAAKIADKAAAFGGTKKFGPTRLPAYGNIWQITDPDGHRFGLFEKQTTTVNRGAFI